MSWFIYQLSFSFCPAIRRVRPHVSGYFWIRNFFFPDSKISPSPRSIFKSNCICPHASDGIRIHCSTQGYSAIKCVRSMRHKARDSGGEFPLLLLLCRHIGLLFGKLLDTNLLRHRIGKYLDSPVYTLSDSLRINFFPLWRADLKISGFAVEFAGCVWTVSGKKKLRIQKYPDTCEGGLRWSSKTTIGFLQNSLWVPKYL